MRFYIYATLSSSKERQKYNPNAKLRRPPLLHLRRLTVDADYSLPVLGGFDVVAYWTLPGGAEPVLGTQAFTALYGNYRFLFSSTENLRAFEVMISGGFCV